MRQLRWIIAVPLFSLLVSACGDVKQIEATSVRAAEQPGSNQEWVVHDDALYSVSLPPDWTKVSDEGQDPRSIGYLSRNSGSFLVVWIWPESSHMYSDYDSDQTWTLDWLDQERSQIYVREKGQLCTSAKSAFCLAGDGKLLIRAKVDFENAFTSGHQFQFDLGSVRSESDVDTALLEQVLESFSVK
jgi:hypothetical protein